jgi:histidinol dehydrogenase
LLEIIHTRQTERLRAKLSDVHARNVALDFALMTEVAAIVEAVRTQGDAAILEYARRFDGCGLQATDLRVSEDLLQESASKCEPDVRTALREAIRRVRRFHELERHHSWESQAGSGTRLGQRITPIVSAGLYVPGGTASYPSSVIMNVVPAQVAGVDRIAVVSPPGTIDKNAAVAAALVELEVSEVYAVGGAQAIAGLAYGTETISRVDKITGPGNRYVAAAKKLVFGVVGIDSLAGPSEVVVFADDTADAEFVASDLLAQAEHSDDACAILITTIEEFARRVAQEVEKQLRSLSRSAIIQESLSRYGAILVVEHVDEACALINELAPEHLELICREEEEIARRVRHAGAIFFGSYTPEVVGDYLAGPNHVLPTAGAARFSSALSVHDFQKRTSLLHFAPDEMQGTAPLIAALARAEGLDGHARSALIRLRSES